MLEHPQSCSSSGTSVPLLQETCQNTLSKSSDYKGLWIPISLYTRQFFSPKLHNICILVIERRDPSSGLPVFNTEDC